VVHTTTTVVQVERSSVPGALSSSSLDDSRLCKIYSEFEICNMQDRACNFLAWTWMQKKSRNGKYILFSTLNISMLFNGGAKESHEVNVRPTLSISSRFFGCVILRRERIFFSITVFMLHSVMRLDWEANDHTHVQGQSRINKDVCLNTHLLRK